MPPQHFSFQAIIHPHSKGQITIHPLWTQTWETFSADHIHTAICTVTEAAAFTEGTLCAPYPATVGLSLTPE